MEIMCLVTSNANDWSSRMQMDGQVHAITHLAEALWRKQCEQWLAKNSEAVNAYNEYVEAHGVSSDSVRSF
ncbi:hypothetical protein PS918_02750 [Pseudomonas fluorescens]|uniref:Post-segregation antitoxin CcdA n=2 Tax=Pseudomonas fluorescens TaxID=294 RepID=A0A5E7SHX0_PSEFL|nr:hypothetical protein PS918_02750 [Pseudomonas fluorescens]